MKSFARIFGLAISFLVIVACEDTNLTKKESATEKDELIASMVEDKDVQEFLINNARLIQKYHAWFNAKSSKEQKAYYEWIDKLHAERKTVFIEFISAEELTKHYKNQENIIWKIKSKFSQFNKYDVGEQAKIRAEVSRLVNEKLNLITTNDPCHEGYNTCSWSCYDKNGGQACYDSCWEGYLTCKRYQQK